MCQRLEPDGEPDQVAGLRYADVDHVEPGGRSSDRRHADDQRIGRVDQHAAVDAWHRERSRDRTERRGEPRTVWHREAGPAMDLEVRDLTALQRRREYALPQVVGEYEATRLRLDAVEEQDVGVAI